MMGLVLIFRKVTAAAACRSHHKEWLPPTLERNCHHLSAGEAESLLSLLSDSDEDEDADGGGDDDDEYDEDDDAEAGSGGEVAEPSAAGRDERDERDEGGGGNGGDGDPFSDERGAL